MNIVEIIPKDDYLLYIRIEDGRTGVFDVSPYLNSEAFMPLREKNEFTQIQNGKYFVEWDCGADFSLDTILARWKPVNNPES